MKSFKQYIVKEDGEGGGGVGPTNVVGTGNIAGTGGKGGEPGVDMKKKRFSPVLPPTMRARAALKDTLLRAARKHK